MVPLEVYQYLAVNVGLLILAAWFYILLLILREFRHFAGTFLNHKQSTPEHDELLAQCRESVARASQFTQQHSKTISELLQVQMTLENQLSQIRASTADHITKEEQSSINELNKKLIRSHKLIKRLKGELDNSGKKLRHVSSKLEHQFQSTDTLRQANTQLQEEIEQLRQDKAGASANAMSDQQTQTLLNQYKRQIEEQNQLIDQLSVEHEGDGSSAEVAALKAELEQTRQKLTHLSKEKNFVESRYLEAIKQNKPQ
ncbi:MULTISPECIES: chromosome partitioning protein ParA [Pseudoalteromonas]|uniref:Chromosome partitioning protein ParA n=2 Tax=Pseudoalteromonas TaxID=53246 RepID=A0A4Q7EL45_9GAMM|nr:MULTISPECIES: chromosome partitioning protein ParA [Pseudoalteromonas]QTL36413.1 chromosome partitioning protein ParA [Pseudoalteromonas viridis]RZM84920.1 chromosome partitioning protein ParA [Pseudoalteromonas rubra]